MKSLLFYLLVVPLALVLVVLGVINRDPVTVVLDPFSPADPTIAVTLPLYVLVFGTVVVGIVIGGAVDWFRQGKWRKAARESRYEAERWQKEAAALQNRPAKTAPPANHGTLVAPSPLAAPPVR